MGKIHQLDTQIANMIAAGEVVERPMGIVKELVENAIDAGSTRIDISVWEGGLEKIVVRDNGSGMDSEDAVNAFLRHATSKIEKEKDLWSIHTLGFRGEALPSIASVSKTTLTTSDGNTSTRVQMEYGKRVKVSAYPFDQGSEISVEGLFYKTPARLKHLKSAAYENSLIQDVIVRFALSHPDIAFVFKSDEKEAVRTTGQGNLLEVMYQVWGREVAENSIPVDFQDYDYHVTGYIVKPNITRASRNYLYVFINGRMVRTYRLYKGILDGYEDFIVKGRNPIVVLNVEMDAQIVDVNVHPSKWEIRLSKENQLQYLLSDEIRKALKGTLLAPNTNVKEAIVPTYEPLELDTKEVLQEAFVGKEKKEAPMVVEEKVVPYEEKKTSFPEMKVLGQLHQKFILCECEEGLAILDQHACQERVHYEELLEKLNQEVPRTELLVPISLQAGADIVMRMDELNEACADLKIPFEAFGKDTILVREVPLWMQEVEEEAFLHDVIELFKNETKPSYQKLEKKKIATMACHRSIRFHRSLTMEEMEEVVKQLSTCENPYHCPHGRPTFVILDEKELTKEFLR
ncbi:MAG: DNA mismatch repair endonuclease MutL [Solobacterium sp.]|nr:DNA mismatch repair endonuclease MutL [Solobacterium sp.]